MNRLRELSGVMLVLLPVLVATGLLLLFPQLAPERVMGAGGIWPMAVAHSIAAYLLTLFLVSHVYLTTTGETPLSDIREMLTGWHKPHAHNSTASVEEAADGKQDEDGATAVPLRVPACVKESSHEDQDS